LIKFHLVVLKI